MYRRDQRETECEKHQSDASEPRFAEPLDHAPKDSRSHEHSHPAQIHDEVADIGLSDWKTVHENERQSGYGAVERADRDRVDPDQALRGLVWPRDDAPHRAGAGLMDDPVLARRGNLLARLAQVNGGEDADQNAEDRGGDSRRVPSPVDECRADRGTDDGAEARRCREPSKTLGAVLGITGVSDVCLDDADRPPAQALHYSAKQQEPEGARVREDDVRDGRNHQAREERRASPVPVGKPAPERGARELGDREGCDQNPDDTRRGAELGRVEGKKGNDHRKSKHVHESRHKRGSLGYWLGVEFWGKGYATQAAIAVLNYGFGTLELHRIEAGHYPRNPASGRVLEKIGMQREGLMRGDVLKGHQFEDTVLYARLSTDF